ncbi:uncharacterized protein [Vulpes vulpes]|uniref:Collagen alpha-1(I) chain-like n=1 Tax=Vulpes vulpes TaxID=9627 RepID=A0ABM4ZFQ9_VULVU
MLKELSSGEGGFNRDGLGERPESGPVRKLGTAPGGLGAGPGRGLGPSTHLGAVSSRSGGRRWRRQPRGASLPSLRRGPGRARGARGSGAEGPRLPLRGAAGAEKAPRSSAGRAGAGPGAGSCRRLLAAPPPRSPLPRPEHRPRRAPPPIRGRRPQPQAPKAGAASSVSERRRHHCRRRRRRRQPRFLRPLRPLPAARAGPSDGRGGTRRLRGLGPGGGARQAGREEPREKGRGAGGGGDARRLLLKGEQRQPSQAHPPPPRPGPPGAGAGEAPGAGIQAIIKFCCFYLLEYPTSILHVPTANVGVQATIIWCRDLLS